MKIIEPQVELWKQEPTLEGAWNQIARATRVCYQSKPKDGESSEDFVKRIILKPALIEGNLNDLGHCRFDFDKMHGAMLEHGTVYLRLQNNRQNLYWWFVTNNKYSKLIEGEDKCGDTLVTTNMRVLIENNKLQDVLSFICKPTKHYKRYTFSVITDIGVTREMNRHRTFSVAEQSTRYCDLTKNKFGNGLSFPLPSWINKDSLVISEVDDWMFSDMSDDLIRNGTCDWDDIDFYIYANLAAQYCYKALRNRGWKPEQARQILPLGLKTQAVYTAFADDWNHFLKLRADNVSGKVHPNMQLVAKKIKEIIETL